MGTVTFANMSRRASSFILEEFTSRAGVRHKSTRGDSLEVLSFPGALPGRALYIIENKVVYTFDFKATRDGETFDAWHVDTPDETFLQEGRSLLQRFAMFPVRRESGEIVELGLTFEHLPKFKARFSLRESQQEGIAPVSKTPELAGIIAKQEIDLDLNNTAVEVKSAAVEGVKPPRSRSESVFSQWQDRMSSLSARSRRASSALGKPQNQMFTVLTPEDLFNTSMTIAVSTPRRV